MKEYNDYFNCYHMDYNTIMRFIARGWTPCLNLKDILETGSTRAISYDAEGKGCVSTMSKEDIVYGVWINRENAMLVLVC